MGSLYCGLPHRIGAFAYGSFFGAGRGRAAGRRFFPLLACCLAGAACAPFAPSPITPSAGHIAAPAVAAPAPAAIPAIVGQTPPVPPPAPPRPQEKYTVVVNEVPVRELLFALARDARVNVDIAPGVAGAVTMNAVEQTLPQLLRRIAAQLSLRYTLDGANVLITPDEPYFHTYRVDYLDMKRDTSHVVQVGSQIASAGATGGAAAGAAANNSATTIASALTNHFWANLVASVSAVLEPHGAPGASETDGSGVSHAVIPHPESGVLVVKATAAQHELVQQLLAETRRSAARQVLIQATIVEVGLSNQHQAGIDWQVLNQAGLEGLSAVSSTITSPPVNTASFFSLRYDDNDPGRGRALSAALRLLEEFGDVNVLSSPQIMALNNQSAILKVVDNVVYFEIEQETSTTQGVATNAFETVVKTVPVGIVMTITPRINADDSVILNVRPSISRINRFVNDPNPALTIASPVPEIRVREMESVLQLNDGQVAVMGGLMQNEDRGRNNAIPGLSRIPLLGAAFRTQQREREKTELVVFLRPLIIRNPGLDGDFSAYKAFFPGEKR